jgi:hypothetical protein
MISFVDSAGRAVRALMVAGVVAPSLLTAQASGDAARLQTQGGKSFSPTLSLAPATESVAGAPATISIEGGARRMLVGATVPHVARVRDAAGAEQREAAVRWTSSDPNIASVNQFGVLTAVRPGPVTVRAVTGSLSAERRYVVETNPVKSLTLSITADQPKTGEVVEVAAMAFDGSGMKVPNVPFLYTFTAAVEDSAIGQLAPAELDQKGRFVAQKAGDYQIIAVAPGMVAHRTVRVSNRNVGESARLVARAPLGAGGHLSDMFSWRGRDGRDYAISCGSAARGQLITFEMSDAGLRAADTAAVDARAISDCVVDSETGIAVVARETANGRGSISAFDVNDPRAIKALGSIDDGFGAIGGVAVYKRHVLALSDARRLDIVSFEDPARPRRVASMDIGGERSTAVGGPSDVSVTDGVAYVALGRGGMALIDVGGGKVGGSLAKPARIGGFHAPFASTHAAYGYRSRTGKWYVITSEDLVGGDAQPSSAQPGFARIVDFSDPSKPEEVARYEVPEAGVQDLWVDGERLYVAAQSGGVRVVDIAADLKGNLYHQGREIARFIPAEAGAPTPNVVAVQPVRGGVLVGDRTSGLWLVRLSPKAGQ